MFHKDMTKKISSIIKRFKNDNIKVVVAESCTGGLLSAIFTEMPGSSEVFERGFVTYSNDAKIESLSVPEEIINKYGPVSEEVAKLMAEGAIKNSKANLAVAVTGVAGPNVVGSLGKPVGLVYIAVSFEGKTKIYENHFRGDREKIRMDVVNRVLSLLD